MYFYVYAPTPITNVGKEHNKSVDVTVFSREAFLAICLLKPLADSVTGPGSSSHPSK